MKQNTPLWFNILSFSFNLFLVAFPFYIGMRLFRYNPELFAVFVGIVYLCYAGDRMLKVVKAIIKDESL